MKKKYSLMTKLKVCYFWLFRHGEGIMVTCGKCRSTKLKLIENNQEGNKFTSKYMCRKCGATAINIEDWN